MNLAAIQPTQRTKRVTPRRKGKSPLRDANWPQEITPRSQSNWLCSCSRTPYPTQPPSNPHTPLEPGYPSQPYKQARRSRVKQFNRRPRWGHFPEITPQPEARRSLVSELPLQLEACRGPAPELLLQPRAHQDPIYEPLYQSGHQGGAISLPPDDCHSVFHHQQSLPHSARHDLILKVGLEPPAVNLASRIPCEDQQVVGNPASRIPHEDQQDAVETTRVRTYLL